MKPSMPFSFKFLISFIFFLLFNLRTITFSYLIFMISSTQTENYYKWVYLSMSNRYLDKYIKAVFTECSHSLQAYNYGTSVYQRLFLSFPILILSLSFSLSLSLTVSLFLSPTHSPIYLSLILSSSLSLSLPLLSLFLSLRFFPPFLSFHLRLFNLSHDYSPSSLSPPDYNRCTNLLCFLCTECTMTIDRESTDLFTKNL